MPDHDIFAVHSYQLNVFVCLFIYFLTTLSIALTIISSGRITQIIDLKRIWKETVVSYVIVLTRDLPGGTAVSQKNRFRKVRTLAEIRGSRYPGRNSELPL